MRNLAIATIFATSICMPIPTYAATSGELGGFVGALSGVHQGSASTEIHGVAPGAALEAVLRSGPFSLHLEGIPTLTAAAGGRGLYGQTEASLALLNTIVSSDVGRTRRYRVGFGFQVVDLTNLNGTTGEHDSVRVTSPIYAVGLSLPTRTGFVDLDVSDDRNIRGVLHEQLSGTETNVPEIGAEVDILTAYRWTRRATVYRAGVRALSYHTRNANLGNLVDRNVGVGLTFDIRHNFGQ